MDYASSESVVTSTGCGYVASVRGTCCDAHREAREDIEVRSGRLAQVPSESELRSRAITLGMF